MGSEGVSGAFVGEGGLEADSQGPPIPILTLTEVAERLRANLHSGAATYKAMYSSVVGGITKDPAAMVLPLDDHMVHRGHAVFDTALIWDGHLYELEPHLDRFLRSGKMARIEPPFPRQELRRILIELVAASGVQAGSLRYYMSAGPGSFNLSMAECVGSTFYAVVIQDNDADDEAEEMRVITSTVPIKPPRFANVKSTNYLPNAMVVAEAAEKGAYTGIWLDQEGFIAEGPNMNVAFVSKEKILMVPAFEKILSGCTAKRTLELAPQLTGGKNPLLREIRVAPVTVEAARAASEMFLIGSGILVKAVTHWDNHPVNDGRPGPVARALKKLLEEDRNGAAYPYRIKVPYL